MSLNKTKETRHRWSDEDKKLLRKVVEELQPEFEKAKDAGLSSLFIWNEVVVRLPFSVTPRAAQRMHAYLLNPAPKKVVEEKTPAPATDEPSEQRGLDPREELLVDTLGELLDVQKKMLEALENIQLRLELGVARPDPHHGKGNGVSVPQPPASSGLG